MIAIDTNILVYAFDKFEEQKRKKCKKILNKIFQGEAKGVVTNQILAEFAYVITTKVSNPLGKREAEAVLGSIINSENWTILNYDSETVVNSLRTNQKFWDSIIIQTLKENNVQKIITENVKDFQNSRVKPQNPMA